ncbi:MAG: PEGA domain-containing protein, partial [Polyangiaceae bacterium]
MRRLFWCAVSCAILALAGNSSAQERAATPDIKRARELDQQGVRAFRDGRFKDAITFFSSAFHSGAPPVELWNIAKCHLKLDEPEAAEDSLHQFLEQPDLTAQDRADATQELNDLRGRPSTLAIDSEPGGATFTIDDSVATRGTTPGSIDIPPGKHHVHVEKEKVGAYDVDVEARLGRALIVQGRLGSSSGNVTSNAPGDASNAAKRTGLVISEELGFFVPKLGSYSGSVRPALHLAARYVFREIGIVALSGGIRFDATTDGWHAGGSTNTVPAGSPPPLCAIGNDF